ncbi:MAG: hypothetical protein IJW77_17360 [Clostridia bacterium]|nr:hypothetical protein [Clostridia bacterium]
MSKKNLDGQGRWRSVNVSFRVSPEEDRLLETFVKLSGMTKQDYITSRLLEKDVTVIGNPRVYRALRDKADELLAEMTRISAGDTVQPELLETLQMFVRILEGMKEEPDDI